MTDVVSTDFPGHWPGEDHSWNLEQFKNVQINIRPVLNPWLIYIQTFHVNFHQNDRFDAIFSLVGLDSSVANAFRRILIAEIPTFAIEDVYMYDNTSIIQDEVLAQRVGLIPFKGSRSALESMEWFKRATEDDPSVSVHSDLNVLKLNLDVACTWKANGKEQAAKGVTDPEILYNNHSVYAKHFIWEPQGNQEIMFGNEPVEPVYPDILVAKMRPGQRIKMTCMMIKGIGADHAKFSPVATASYRLMPTIDITSPIIGADAKKFARCFPKGVIVLQPITSEDVKKYPELAGKEGEVKAVVDNPMKDTVSRECLRHPEFKDKVKLGRMRDHFIFRVESTGQQDSDKLFLESVAALKLKARRVKLGLDAMMK